MGPMSPPGGLMGVGERQATVAAPPPGESSAVLPPFPTGTFDAFYLGHEVVKELMGNQVVKDAVKRNEEKRKAEQGKSKPSKGSKKQVDGDAVTLVVTATAVKTVERISGEIVMGDFIKRIAFTCVAEQTEEHDIFAYIGHNDRIGVTHCHIFRVAPTVGKKITAAISMAFKYQADFEKKQGENPFAVTDPKREPIEGILFYHQIHRADLKAIKNIGAGQFGAVYLAKQFMKPGEGEDGGNTITRAVKIMTNSATADDKKEFLREAETMLKLQDRNLISIIGVAVQQRPWLCVLEFMKYGDLHEVLCACAEKNLPLSYPEQLHFCVQLSSGLAHMASLRLIHMDVAARNCMVTSNNIVKVGDFGLTREMDPGCDYLILKEKLRLPIKWVSIEGLDEKIFGEFSDMWSFGVLMWEIFMYGETPYKDIRTADVQAAVRRGLRLEKPHRCPDKMFEMMSRCWLPDRKVRWRFAELKVALIEELRAQNAFPTRDIGAMVNGDPQPPQFQQYAKGGAIPPPAGSAPALQRRYSYSQGPQGAMQSPPPQQLQQQSQPQTPMQAPARSGSISVQARPLQVASIKEESEDAEEAKPRAASVSAGSVETKCAACGLSFVDMDSFGIQLHKDYCSRERERAPSAGANTFQRTPQPQQQGLQRTGSMFSPAAAALPPMQKPPLSPGEQPGEKKKVVCPLCDMDLSGKNERDVSVHIDFCQDAAAIFNEDTSPSSSSSQQPSSAPAQTLERRNSITLKGRGITLTSAFADSTSDGDARVTALLASLELKQYEDLFAEGDVSYEELLEYTDDDLMDLGIEVKLHRLRITDALRRIKSGPQQQQQGSEGRRQSVSEARRPSVSASMSAPAPAPTPAPAAGGPSDKERDAHLASLREQAAQARQRAEAAEKLKLSQESERKLQMKTSTQLFSGEAPKHSKIYDALNPKPLWFQTARERAEQEEDAVNVGRASIDENRNAGFGNFQRDLEKEAEEERKRMTGSPTFGFGSEAEEEEEVEEETVDPSNVPDFGEFREVMMRLRQEREIAAQKHREELRHKFEEEKRRKQALLDDEIRKIRERDAIEKKKLEITDEFVERTRQRLASELNFGNFTFKAW